MGEEGKHSAVHTCSDTQTNKTKEKPRRLALDKHAHAAGMPRRRRWHLDGVGAGIRRRMTGICGQSHTGTGGRMRRRVRKVS